MMKMHIFVKKSRKMAGINLVLIVGRISQVMAWMTVTRRDSRHDW